MNATATQPASPADLRIVQLTQHWTIEHGAFYRDAVVELPDGSRRLVGIRDDLVPVAA
jgi:hypothetical protein